MQFIFSLHEHLNVARGALPPISLPLLSREDKNLQIQLNESIKREKNLTKQFKKIKFKFVTSLLNRKMEKLMTIADRFWEKHNASRNMF